MHNNFAKSTVHNEECLGVGGCIMVSEIKITFQHVAVNNSCTRHDLPRQDICLIVYPNGESEGERENNREKERKKGETKKRKTSSLLHLYSSV